MKRKQIFFFVIALIFLIIIGGYIYFVFQVLPEQKETEGGLLTKEEISPETIEAFEKTIAQLDTPDKLIEFMNENFILESREGDIAFSPEYLFQKKKGGAQDFAVFAAFVLDRHRYETGIMRYRFSSEKETGINTIVVLRDIKTPKCLYFDGGKVNVLQYGSSFKELIKAEEGRLNINIVESKVFYPGVLDLTPTEWTQKW